MKFYCHSRYVGFKFAFSGLKRLVGEPNFRIHMIIATLTTFGGILCGISLVEWCYIILCFVLVLVAEVFNTVIEILADRICRNV